MERFEIIKVLVGSRAHGLNTADSDFDYRSVYVMPLDEIAGFELAEGKPKGKWSLGDGQDNTAYEIGHFLKLACKSNPSILEVFQAHIVESTELALPKWPNKLVFRKWDKKATTLTEDLRGLFPHVWSSAGVRGAFGGYSRNQRRKMLDDLSGERFGKYATAAVRTFLIGIQLLREGTFALEVPAIWRNTLTDIKDGHMTAGAIFDILQDLNGRLEDAYKLNPDKQTNRKVVREWLASLRRAT